MSSQYRLSVCLLLRRRRRREEKEEERRKRRRPPPRVSKETKNGLRFDEQTGDVRRVKKEINLHVAFLHMTGNIRKKQQQQQQQP